VTEETLGHDDEGHVHHPKGTLFIMSLYLLLMVATWVYVFFVMSARI
jgi:hypothetical protein